MTKTWTQPELIKYYTKHLAQVKKHWPTNSKSEFENDRAQAYLDSAQKLLEDAKTGILLKRLNGHA